MPRARPTPKNRKTPVRKPTKSSRLAKGKAELAETAQASVDKNRAALWNAYRDLQKRADKAWEKLQYDVKRKASVEVILADRNALALLLGECHYMTRECMSLLESSKSSRQP